MVLHIKTTVECRSATGGIVRNVSGLPHRGVAVVDDLSHKVGEEDGLGDDGEPGEQVAGAQPQQLRGHLQHGEPQQSHGGLDLFMDRKKPKSDEAYKR